MKSLLDALTDPGAWEAFRQKKIDRGQLSRSELRSLDSFLAEKRYLAFAGDRAFGYPEKKEIAKMGSQKKRTVYSYAEDEMWALKFLARGLYRYDSRLSDCCYSFRPGRTAKTAFDRILALPDLSSRCSLKLDIHDYFNSIDTGRLLPLLEEVLADDPRLFALFRDLLTQDKCIWRGELISEKRGAMAGVPLSGFCADLYLRSLDDAMTERGIPFFRYSDDMILFAKSPEERADAFAFLQGSLADLGLTLNMAKYEEAGPGQPWTFLGFVYEDGKIDLAPATVRKMQGKIRRKAAALWRWRKRTGASFERAASAMIRSFDRRFYDLTGTNEFSWIRFYFPVITRTEGLRAIDRTLVQYLRYLSSGRHYKGNYRVAYEDLVRLGYTPLVAEYFRWKEENARLSHGEG
ncbi:MAG: hypothetical protein IJL66_03545 [Lachnospiraceae bacterium]|nr:hypothetical protein [Lachnospiraceae bacterium]